MRESALLRRQDIASTRSRKWTTLAVRGHREAQVASRPKRESRSGVFMGHVGESCRLREREHPALDLRLLLFAFVQRISLHKQHPNATRFLFECQARLLGEIA